MPREELAELQWARLKHSLAFARANSEFWRERLPADIRSMDDYFARVPLVCKSDLIAAEQLAQPYGTLPSTDPRLAIRHHQTSGTSGNPPVRTFDTARDWAWGADMWATSLYGMGVREHHRGMTAFGYGMFIGFWGMHYGLERIGCTVIPSGGLDSKARVRLLVEHQVEVLGCTPSYAMRLQHTAGEMGIDLRNDANVKIIMAGGEPRPAATTRAIEESFGARVHNAAGTTEFGTICMFECESRAGCHIIESGMVDEVLDPDTKLPVGYGERGVRVTTGLGREGIQLFRHWTDDLVVRRPWSECDCGRTWDMYDGGILGRRDDMHKIRGVSVTPVMIEEVVQRFTEVADFQAIIRVIGGLDTIVLRAELAPGFGAEGVGAEGVGAEGAGAEGVGADLSGLGNRISDLVKHEIGIRPVVEIVQAGTLPRFELKAARFHDERSQLYLRKPGATTSRVLRESARTRTRLRGPRGPRGGADGAG